MKTTRRLFLTGATYTIATAGVLITACSDDETTTTTTTAAGGCSDSAISGNHGHVLTVSQADLDAGAETSYDIEGDGGHPHTIVITAADFQTLAGGGTVDVTSSTDAGHDHVVTVSCA